MTPEARLRQQAGNIKRADAFRKKWTGRKRELMWLYEIADMSQEQIADYYKDHLRIIQKAMKLLGIRPKGRGRRRGPSHYNYKNGLHNRDYRRLITKDKCRKCGATENLGIHHKNDDHFDNRLENLEVLCQSCHMSETKRKWWIAKKAGLPTPKSNAPLGWNRKKL